MYFCKTAEDEGSLQFFFLIEAKAKRGVVGNRRCLCFVKLFYCSIVELLHCYIARKTRFEAEAKAQA